ncbi:MAG: NTP transferase domain-containing protein [Clostridiales bacterium]|nr:NTP transferase domain-containing protein [Clostridiales bacterium]
MISLVLAAGYATRLYPLTENFPKPLLKVAGRTILDRLLADVDALPEVSRHVIVTNRRFIGHFKDWQAAARYQKPIELLDDGTESNDTRLGAIRDVQLAIDCLALDDDLLVMAGDNLLDFSLSGLTAFARKKDATSILCYREPDIRRRRRAGVIVPGDDFRVLSMVEKPENPPSEWTVPPFYVYSRRDLPQVAASLRLGVPCDAPGSFIAWLCGRSQVFAWPMPGRRYDVGTLDDYREICALFERRAAPNP